MTHSHVLAALTVVCRPFLSDTTHQLCMLPARISTRGFRIISSLLLAASIILASGHAADTLDRSAAVVAATGYYQDSNTVVCPAQSSSCTVSLRAPPAGKIIQLQAVSCEVGTFQNTAEQISVFGALGNRPEEEFLLDVRPSRFFSQSIFFAANSSQPFFVALPRFNAFTLSGIVTQMSCSAVGRLVKAE
jgi:hypothetical protein